MAPNEKQTIGLVVRGGVDPASWSGIPAGVLRGLEERGCDVVVCNAEITMGTYRVLQVYLRATRQREEGWFVAPSMMKARELTARWRRRRLPPVSGWIFLGSEFGLP